MPTFLLTTKLYFPPARPALVARPRLVERLQAGLGGPLTLISAPAGSGKTTLVSEWRGGPGAGMPAAWLSLDPGDNDGGLFFQYLAACLDAIQTEISKKILPLLASMEMPPLEGMMTLLVNSLSSLKQDAVLLMDDYHVIDNPKIHQAMGFLLDHLPEHLHLVLLTRSDPPLALARLRARGQLLEIREEHLRFNLDEAGRFLNQVMGLALSREQVSALEDRSEGWIAGLQLAALSLQDQPETAGFVSAFTGSHHYIVDYLAEEVLNRQPELIREFLLQTCILDRLTEPLCNAVTGRSDSQLMLETLEQSNLFLVGLDNNRGWYRYHRLFADMLLSRLQKTQRAGLPDLHRRASIWYAEHDQIQPALDHALAGGHPELAARIIEEKGETVLASSQWGLLLTWLKTLPDSLIRAKPRLSLLYAWCLVMTDQFVHVETYLGVVEGSHAGSDQGDERLPTSWQGQVAAIRGHVAYLRGDYNNAIGISKSAFDILPKEDLTTRFYLAVTLCLCYVYTGKLDEAGRLLEEARSFNQVVGSPTMMLAAAGMLAEIQEIRGLLHQSANTYREILRTGHGRVDPVVISAQYHLANVLYEWNDLENAGVYLQASLEGSDLIHWPDGSLLARLCLARQKIVQGDPSMGRELIQQALVQMEGFAGSNLYDHITGFLAQLALDLGDMEIVGTCMAGFTLPAEDTLAENFFLRKTKYIVHVRLLDADGHLEDARRILVHLLQAAEKNNLVGCQVELLAWDALIAYKIAIQSHRKDTEGQAALLRALERGISGGYLRTFVDMGKTMGLLIEECHKKLKNHMNGFQTQRRDQLMAYLANIHAIFASQEPSKLEFPGEASSNPLSRRELELLTLIGAGRSNKEIASQLVISVATVKRHTTNIFHKLDARNRTEAVARARELELL